jgi:hypothetical protein
MLFTCHNEWVKLSPEQQQKVRDLKAERDERRNVQQVAQNVKPKTDNEGKEGDSTKNSTVGAIMSQRKPFSREL